MTRKGILFLSPILPDDTGNGLAMRAGVTLRALSRRFDVHLGLVPVAGKPAALSALVNRYAATIRSLALSEHLDPYYALIERVIDPEARRRARLAYPKPHLSRFCTGKSAATVAEWCRPGEIVAVHVMRLYLAPLVRAMGDGFRVLDLDEDDVETHRRIAQLEPVAQTVAHAEEPGEASKYALLQAQEIPRFQGVMVSSPVEAARIAQRFPEVAPIVIRNAAPMDAKPLCRAHPEPGQPLRLIFVGNLGYAPNNDAALFLCREIVPRLRAACDRAVTVGIVGGGASAELITTAEASNVELPGLMEDLRPWYAQADIAIVPIRAGGGTRIKILEAFAYGTPVVATPVGIEGIEAIDGEHALIADGAEGLVRACLMLNENPQRARDIAARAMRLVDEVYHPDRIMEALLAVYDACP